MTKIIRNNKEKNKNKETRKYAKIGKTRMDIVKKDRNVRTNRYTKKKHYCGNNHEKGSNGQK